MGRATAGSAVTRFAVLRNFELMKNGPAWAKIAGAVSFAYRLNRLACAVSRWQLRFRPIGAGASPTSNIEAGPPAHASFLLSAVLPGLHKPGVRVEGGHKRFDLWPVTVDLVTADRDKQVHQSDCVVRGCGS